MSEYLTDLDIIKLIKLSYMDLSSQTVHEEYVKETNRIIEERRKISELAVPIKDRGWIQTDGFLENQREIMAGERLKDLAMIGHINDNTGEGNPHGTGLVAYALLNEEMNEIYFLCRGSEGGLFNFAPNWMDMLFKRQYINILKSEDWRDNFYMIFEDSKAFTPLMVFVDDIIKKRNDVNTAYYAYGHSKGGGQALFLSANYGFSGKAIDGVGLSPVTLYEKPCYKYNIKESGFTNLVAENDIVGLMLLHPEKMVKAKMVKAFSTEEGKTVNPYELDGFTWAHYPQALYTGTTEMAVKGESICLIPIVVAIINKFFMLKLSFDGMCDGDKKENLCVLEEAENNCIKAIQILEMKSEVFQNL